MIGKLKWIGRLEPYELVITENPLEEIWHMIDFLTAEETISQCIPPVDKELTPFICESIAQAEEFRHSAAESGEHTKPLLTYYSIHNLTKAVLALELNKKPPGYHGLMRVELPKDEAFPGTSVQMNYGVFSELLSSNKIEPIKNMKITADDLMKRCGYLIRDYAMAYDKESLVIVPRLSADLYLNEMELSFHETKEVAEQNLPTAFPRLMDYFEIIKGETGVLTMKLKDGVPRGDLNSIQKVLKDTLTISIFGHPPYFLVPCTDSPFNWPQEAYLYALSFILCSLVRYYPDYWYNNIIAHKRNRWIIRKINSIVERVYPNLMLNIMFGYRLYRFSPSAE